MDATTAPRPALRASRIPIRRLRAASDDRLVAEIRRGSESAFEAVFDRHHRPILGFCRHMLSSPEEAEDALQHTFMAAYRDLVGSDKTIQLKPWLFTIARNRCLSVLRARRDRPTDDIDGPSLDGLAAEVQRREDLRDLLRDVSDLPDDQRAALVLAEVGDVSHDEIAMILEVPKAKVKALVFQARSSLIASRTARETPCEEIREQLANLRGGSLRRTTLRRHVAECAGCAEFKRQLDAQRRSLAIVLPVLPALGLKEAILGSIGGGGAGGGAAAAAGGAGAGAGGGGLFGGAAATGFGGIAAKIAVVIAVAGGAGTAGVLALPEGSEGGPASVEEQAAAARDDALAGGAGGVAGLSVAGFTLPVAMTGPNWALTGADGGRARSGAMVATGAPAGGRAGLGGDDDTPGGGAGGDDGSEGAGDGEGAKEPKGSKGGDRGDRSDDSGATKTKKAKKPKRSGGNNASPRGAANRSRGKGRKRGHERSSGGSTPSANKPRKPKASPPRKPAKPPKASNPPRKPSPKKQAPAPPPEPAKPDKQRETEPKSPVEQVTDGLRDGLDGSERGKGGGR